jgi:hypothetical protein
MDYAYWCGLSEDELARQDIARVNLECAVGLPGTENLDIDACLRKLDQWTELVAIGTKRSLRKRARRIDDPEYRDESEAHFRMLVLVTVLQRNLGVRYSQAFSIGDYDASDARNLFLHGLLTGHGGTCVTMPVLYTAIGRRLGYPLKLVSLPEHMICRWDDPDGERFNIEATSLGFNPQPDEYYLNWRRPITPDQVKSGLFLSSMKPKRELAFFLSQRGWCFLDNIDPLRSTEAFCWAARLAPDIESYDEPWALTTVMHRLLLWHKDQPGAPRGTSVLRIRMPETELEKKFFAAANCNFSRILRNRRRRQDEAAKAASSTLAAI